MGNVYASLIIFIPNYTDLKNLQGLFQIFSPMHSYTLYRTRYDFDIFTSKPLPITQEVPRIRTMFQ